MPVLFSAKPDAPLAATLWPRSRGKPVDAKLNVPSRFEQMSVLVLGQNNVNVWSRTVDRLAVAVTEECPYTIEIVEPKVPLVRGGSMGLKVRAIRKPGFKAAISVYLPWNPPGVGSGGGIAIPERQNEAVIPMNADGGAELRTWKIVVNGASGVASGPIMVSSQLANLTIAAALRRPRPSRPPASIRARRSTWRSRSPRPSTFPGEAQVTLDRAAQQGHDRRQEDHQGHDRPGLPHQDRQGLAGRQSCQPVLPGGDHAERRADRAQYRHRHLADRRAAAAQGQCAGPAPAVAAGAQAGAAAAAAKPLTRLEKLRLETKQAKTGK